VIKMTTKKLALLILKLLIIALIALPIPHLHNTYAMTAAEKESQWIRISSNISKHVVLVDTDFDGIADRVAIDNAIITPTGSYITNSIPFKMFFQDNENPCTLFYNAFSGNLRIICKNSVYDFSVPANATLHIYRYGVSIGDVIISRGFAYKVNVPGAPVYVDGELAVVTTYGGWLRLYYVNRGVEEKIYQMSLRIFEATYNSSSKMLYIIASSETSTYILKYNISSKIFYYEPLNIGSALQVFSTSKSVYILTDEGALYRVELSTSKTMLIDYGSKIFYPADSPNSLILLGKRKVVKIIDYGSSINFEERQLPNVDSVYAVDWYGPLIAVATNLGVYIASTKSLELSINYPTTVYAGQLFTIRVASSYPIVITSIDNSMFRSSNGVIVANISLPKGVHKVGVVTCLGILCIHREGNITSIPKPLKLVVYYPAEVRPYQNISIAIRTFDALSNYETKVSCVIRDSHGNIYKVLSGSETSVVATPDIDSAVFTITCGNEYYAEESKIIKIDFSEPYLAIKTIYNGSGNLCLTGYNKYLETPWNDEIKIVLNNKNTSLGKGIACVKLRPGDNKLSVFLIRNNITYYSQNLDVVYYENVWSVPAGERVVIGDRVTTTTVVVTKTEKFPVVYEVKTIDPLAAIGIAVLASSITYVALLLVNKARRG